MQNGSISIKHIEKSIQDFESLELGRPFSVAFVHAPDSFYADTQNYGVQFMPVWAYTLASHIHHPKIKLFLYDTRHEPPKNFAPADLFIFSGINQDYGHMVKIHKILKEKYPQSLFLIGGPLCWSFHKGGDVEKLFMFDHIFVGDGEQTLPDFLYNFSHGRTASQVIVTSDRFPIKEARGFYRPFVNETVQRYYGAVLEVSRGCPFLCEFCDIRILPDNNRPHNKDPKLIASEMDYLSSLGIKQVLLACDNFIGDPQWAEQVVDELLAWQKKSGYRPSLYTWLTINLYKQDRLMKKMRQAGFDMLFIGIESFNNNSLLETAKVQNTSTDLTTAVKTIQSYGFVIVAGIIFGFDSDPDNIFEMTANGLMETGLISGDPSLLTALPGTPLHRRMQLTGRLRKVRYGLGGFKYQTNIQYLMPKEQLLSGYRKFIAKINAGRFQYLRLMNFFSGLNNSNFIPLQRQGYGNLSRFALMVFRNPVALKQHLQRLWKTVRDPSKTFYIFLALYQTIRLSRKYGRLHGYFQFWLFVWTNSILKYGDLTDSDFDIESIPADYDPSKTAMEDYVSMADEDIPKEKILAQQRVTTTQLKNLATQKAALKSS